MYKSYEKDSFYICPFVQESGNTLTHNVKTITPAADAGCKKTQKL